VFPANPHIDNPFPFIELVNAEVPSDKFVEFAAVGIALERAIVKKTVPMAVVVASNDANIITLAVADVVVIEAYRIRTFVEAVNVIPGLA